MKLKLLASSMLLAYSAVSHATPMIQGNTLISNDVIDRNLSYGKPESVEEAARIVVSLYEQYGHQGTKAKVDGDVIHIMEPNAEVSGDDNKDWMTPKKEGAVIIGDIQNSMAMADVSNRFQAMDAVVGDLKGDGTVDMTLQHAKSGNPYEASVNYSSRGQDATSRDLVTIMGAAHVGGGVRVDASLIHGLSELRPDSKGGRMDAGRLSARKATQYGVFSVAGDMNGNEIGSKEATRSEYELSGKTTRASIGHRYVFPQVGTLTNNLNWVKREQNYGLFDIYTNQEYKTWSTAYYGQFGAQQINATVTKGLTGKQDFNYIPLMGTFNPYFYSTQLGYGYQGHALGNQLGYGISGSYFSGSKDMPSAERLSIGGAGRGSSHNNGVVTGYKGYFGEARLYGLRTVLLDYGLKPYISLNGANTTDALGTDYEVIATEAGLLGRWKGLSSTVSYSNSIKEKNVDHDARLNLDVNYAF